MTFSGQTCSELSRLEVNLSGLSADFHVLLEALSGPALIVAKNGRIVAANAAFADRLAQPSKNLVATRQLDLSLLDLLDEATRAPTAAFLARCADKGTRQRGMFALSTAPSLRYRCEGTALRPLDDADAKLILLQLRAGRHAAASRPSRRDRTNGTANGYRRPLQLPPASREHLHELLWHVPIAIYATDAVGRVTYFNQAAADLAGRKPQVGSDMWCVSWRLHSPDGSPMAHADCPMAKALATREPVRNAEVLVERPDGTRVPVVPYPTPLCDATGRLIGAVNVLVDISERKKIEHELQNFNETLEQRVDERTHQMRAAYERLGESEERFRRLVDGVIDYALFMLDPNGIVTNWNSGAERIKGYKAHEIVGQHFSRFYQDVDREAKVPEHGLRMAARDGRYEAEGWRVRKDGKKFWANVVIDAIRDDDGELVGFAKITRDITERKRAQEELIERERMARTIIDTAFDAFVQMDEAGKIVEWNKQAQNLFGWSRDDAIGTPLVDLIVPVAQREERRGELALFLHDGNSARSGESLQWEVQRRDGKPVTAELAITVMRFGDRLLLNGFIHDLTQKIASEAQLRKAQKMEAIGQLTSGIAHDFNNLLTVVLGSLDLLGRWTLGGDNVPKEKLQARLSGLQRAVSRGERLTKQLLAFSRQSVLTPQVVAIEPMIRDFTPFLQHALGEAVIIKSDFAAGEVFCRLDPAQFEAAIINLAINARDAMPKGGYLTIATGRVVIDAQAAHPALSEGNYIRVTLADTGVGMPPHLLDKVFEPFFTTKEIGKGTGLGLAQVWGFVTQSGGHIDIKSEVGKGTVVALYMPECADVPEQDGATAEIKQDEATVLVVDDDEDIRKVVAGMLENCGYRTRLAANGNEALAILREGETIDLLFSDCVMPNGPAGADLARAAQALRPELSILLSTGYIKTTAGQEPDSDNYPIITKPYALANLSARVRAVLDKSRSAAPVAAAVMG